MEDKNITEKVLEALSLNMKESSLSKEIEAITGQIQKLIKEREAIEASKRQYLICLSGATRAAQDAKTFSIEAEKRIKEAKDILDKSVANANEADKFLAIIKRTVVDFDTPIKESNKAIDLSDTGKRQLQKNISDIKIRKEELKKEGINLNLDGTPKVPSRMSI